MGALSPEEKRERNAQSSIYAIAAEEFFRAGGGRLGTHQNSRNHRIGQRGRHRQDEQASQGRSHMHLARQILPGLHHYHYATESYYQGQDSLFLLTGTAKASHLLTLHYIRNFTNLLAQNSPLQR